MRNFHFNNDVIQEAFMGQEGLLYLSKKSKSEIDRVDLIVVDTLGTHKQDICSFTDTQIKCFHVTATPAAKNFELLMGTGCDF